MTQRLARPQRGGTLIGFILGLLVGLGAALAVAVYVTKVPVPFVDRGVQRSPNQDAIEAERNKDWNPNAALGGKAPVAPSPATPATPGSAASTPPAAPAPSAPAQTAPPGKTDPLGELIQQRTTSPGPVATVEAPAQADPFIYFVQVGAFRGAEEAEAQRARLAMLGFNVKVSEREQAGRPVFRVRLGPFNQQADATAQQDKLKAQNVDTALVRVQR